MESSNQESGFWGKFFFEMREFLRYAIVALIVVLPIRFFVAQPFVVRGASMEPNFQESEYLIIDEASYYFREPERGEVIVFRYPQNPSEFFIKRIIGLPGEKVEIRDNKVYLTNAEQPEGFILSEEYLPRDALTIYDTNAELTGEQYFVMGDNRLYSSDSRRWGPLERKYVIGRALLRLWPPSQAGVVQGVAYPEPVILAP